MNAPFTDFVDLISEKYQNTNYFPNDLISLSPLLEPAHTIAKPGQLTQHDNEGYVNKIQDVHFENDVSPDAESLNAKYMKDDRLVWGKYLSQISDILSRATGIYVLNNGSDTDMKLLSKAVDQYQDQKVKAKKIKPIEKKYRGVLGPGTFSEMQRDYHNLRNVFKIDVKIAVRYNDHHVSKTQKESAVKKLEEEKIINPNFPLDAINFALAIAKFQKLAKIPHVNGKLGEDSLKKLGPLSQQKIPVDIEEKIVRVSSNIYDARDSFKAEIRAALNSLGRLIETKIDVHSAITSSESFFSQAFEVAIAVASFIPEREAAKATVEMVKTVLGISESTERSDKMRSDAESKYTLASLLDDIENEYVFAKKREEIIDETRKIIEPFSSHSEKLEKLNEMDKMATNIIHIKDDLYHYKKIMLASIISHLANTRIIVQCDNYKDPGVLAAVDLRYMEAGISSYYISQWQVQDIKLISNRASLKIEFTSADATKLNLEGKDIGGNEEKILQAAWDMWQTESRKGNFTLNDLLVKKDIFFRVFLARDENSVAHDVYLKTLDINESKWEPATKVYHYKDKDAKMIYFVPAWPNRKLFVEFIQKKPYKMSPITKGIDEKNNFSLGYLEIILDITNAVMQRDFKSQLSDRKISYIQSESESSNNEKNGNLLSEFESFETESDDYYSAGEDYYVDESNHYNDEFRDTHNEQPFFKPPFFSGNLYEDIGDKAYTQNEDFHDRYSENKNISNFEGELTASELQNALQWNAVFMTKLGWVEKINEIIEKLKAITKINARDPYTGDINYLQLSRAIEKYQLEKDLFTKYKDLKTKYRGVLEGKTWSLLQDDLGLLKYLNKHINITKAIQSNRRYSQSLWGKDRGTIINYFIKIGYIQFPVDEKYFAYVVAYWQGMNDKLKYDHNAVTGILDKKSWDLMKPEIKDFSRKFSVKEDIRWPNTAAASKRFVVAMKDLGDKMSKTFTSIQFDISNYIQYEKVQFDFKKELGLLYNEFMLDAINVVPEIGGVISSALKDVNAFVQKYLDNAAENALRQKKLSTNLTLSEIILFVQDSVSYMENEVDVNDKVKHELLNYRKVEDKKKFFDNFKTSIARIEEASRNPNQVMRVCLSTLIGLFSSNTSIIVYSDNKSVPIEDWAEGDIQHIIKDTDRKRLHFQFSNTAPQRKNFVENSISESTLKILKGLWEIWVKNKFTLYQLMVEKEVYFGMQTFSRVGNFYSSFPVNKIFLLYIKKLGKKETSWTNATDILGRRENMLQFSSGADTITKPIDGLNNTGRLTYRDIILKIVNDVMNNEYNSGKHIELDNEDTNTQYYYEDELYEDAENTEWEEYDNYEEETTPSARYSQNSASIFITITGEKQGQIKGDTIQKGKEGMIAAYTFRHEIVSPRDSASGMATGRRVHKPVSVTKEVDGSSTRLLNALVTNERLKEVVINFWRPASLGARAGVATNYYRVKLTDVFISNISQEKSALTEPNITLVEKVEFVYEKIEWQYLQGSQQAAADDWKQANEIEFHEAVEETEWEEENEIDGENEMMNELEDDEFDDTIS